MLSPRKTPVANSVKIKRAIEMKEVYQKPFGMNTRGERDVSYRRRSSLEDACIESMRHRSRHTNEDQIVGQQFSFHEARKAFLTFCRNFPADERKPSHRFLALFEAVITKLVNFFKYILQDLIHDERYIGKLKLKLRQESQHNAKLRKLYAQYRNCCLIHHKKALSDSKHWSRMRL